MPKSAQLVICAPEDFEAHLGLGKTLFSMAEDESFSQDFDAAWKRMVKHLSQAIALQKNSAEAYFWFAKAHSVCPEDFDEMDKAFREAVRLGCGRAEAFYLIGITCMCDDKLIEAEEWCRKAVLCMDADEFCYVQLAAVLMKQGRYIDAEAAYRSCISLWKPPVENPWYRSVILCDLAEALYQQKSFAQAEENFRLSIDLQENNYKPHCGLIKLLREQERFCEANAAYGRALSVCEGAATYLREANEK